MLTLILKEGDQPRTLELSQDVITIGRSKQNTISLKNIKASRQHAKIERIGGTYQITDCGSGNGTKVNGEKIDFQTLGAGDEIKIGDATLTLKSIDDGVEGIDPESDTPVGDDIKIEIQEDDEIKLMDDERETELAVKPAPPPHKAAPAPPKPAPAPQPAAAKPAAPPAAAAKPLVAPRPRPSLADRFKKKKE